jgi:Flp pilus assembly pilin Flp
MLTTLLARLWNDESGAVIATEYLMLGSIVALGGASGMVAMRDSVVDEYKELGQGVRNIRQAYTAPGLKSGSAAVSGSAATDAPHPAMPNTPTAQQFQFSCPTP